MGGNRQAEYRTLLEAASFAARAHQGHFRKDDKTPYISHPFRVCLILRHVFGVADPETLMAGLLHDTIEDTRTDFDDLKDEFGSEVAAWVDALSKDKRKPEDEREAAYCQTLAKASPQVRLCKLADLFDNLMDLPNLPAEKRERSLRNGEKYLDTLRANAPPETLKALSIVAQLMDEIRNNAETHHA